MSQSIYRQAALDRMASPERLDAPLVPRPLWILLASFAVALVAVIIWSVVTRAPVSLARSKIWRAELPNVGLAQKP